MYRPLSARSRQRPARRHPYIHRWTPALACFLVVVTNLAACSLNPFASGHTVTIGVMLPATGASGALGRSMAQAVDLAVAQNHDLGGGYTLTVTHSDEASGAAPAAARLVADPSVMGVVGPLSSEAAVSALPALATAGIATVSPMATLPGLTNTDLAAREGLAARPLRPQGKSNVFFRMSADDIALATAAASVAMAAPPAHGLGSHSVFVVDDGSISGKAQAAAFVSALRAADGAVAGQYSIPAGNAENVQRAVSSIIKPHPDSVFYAGGIADAAALRSALTLTGVPTLPLLVAGPIADDPGWQASVGGAVDAAYTTALLPAPNLSTSEAGQAFAREFHTAYPTATATPLTALAYDAAMEEITAVKSLISAHQDVTRAAVLSAVAKQSHTGVTGPMTFNSQGERVPLPPFAVYTCDAKGAWTYQTSIPSSRARA